MGTAYDPGTAGSITSLGHGQFEVSSWREADVAYYVDVCKGTCTCRHFTKRLVGTGTECKHLTQARAERWAGLAETAQRLSDAALTESLAKYGNDPAVGGCLRVERCLRKQRAEQEQALKAVFS